MSGEPIQDATPKTVKTCETMKFGNDLLSLTTETFETTVDNGVYFKTYTKSRSIGDRHSKMNQIIQTGIGANQNWNYIVNSLCAAELKLFDDEWKSKWTNPRLTGGRSSEASLVGEPKKTEK